MIFFNIYYRLGEHFTEEFLAISIQSFLRNPVSLGLVNLHMRHSAIAVYTYTLPNEV
jgi:hypothetical protein